VATPIALLLEDLTEFAGRIGKWADGSLRHTKTLTFILAFEADHLSRKV
jgi:hypothetical protein